jgi:hypothetical protein
MSDTEIDETIELVRQSIITSKSGKHCLKDFSGEVFELTADMLVKEHSFNKEEAKELSGVAECILHKYAKLLALS